MPEKDTSTVNALSELAELYIYQNIDSALMYSNNALALSENLFFYTGTAGAYRELGRINRIAGHYEKALNYFYKALKINDKLKDTLNRGRNFAEISIIHYYQGNLDKSLEFCLKAADIFKKKNISKDLANVYNNIGLIYSGYNKLDTAQNYFDKTITIAKQIGNNKIIISALGNTARNFLLKKEYRKSINKFIELSKKINSENDKSTLSLTYSNISMVYLKLAEKNNRKKISYADSSLKYAEKALKYADEVNANSLRLYAYNSYTEAYKLKKNYRKAFEYLEKFTDVNDSIFSKDKINAIAAIETKYQNEKKQLIIESLQKEKISDDKIIQKQKTIIFIVIVGFIIVLVLLLFLIYLYRSKKRALFLLDEKNKDILIHREEIAAQRDKISEIAFELKKSNRTKNKLFSIIAHDLKNPFQGIIGFSEMIKEEAEKSDLKTISKYAKYIYNASNQTYKFLDNLLNFTRSQIGLLKYNPKNINLKNIFDDSITLIQSNAKEKGVSLINETNKTLTAYADETMISTVMRNLISNAVKFTSEGGFVKITAKKDKDSVIIKIIDNGTGIKETDIPKLFKADLNFSTFGTHNEKGTGLGLVVCKDFIKKNNGTISVESEIGKGSAFTILLPANK
ncbi:MAG: sensor histidine kinase [Chlorobi bacterium]|nr:sensor histidine kinase [Chlorobiota bacterium]